MACAGNRHCPAPFQGSHLGAPGSPARSIEPRVRLELLLAFGRTEMEVFSAETLGLSTGFEGHGHAADWINRRRSRTCYGFRVSLMRFGMFVRLVVPRHDCLPWRLRRVKAIHRPSLPYGHANTTTSKRFSSGVLTCSARVPSGTLTLTARNPCRRQPLHRVEGFQKMKIAKTRARTLYKRSPSSAEGTEVRARTL